VIFPCEIMHACIQFVGICRAKTPQYHDHARGKTRPQAGAVGVYELTLKCNLALKWPNSREVKRLQFVGQKPFEPSGTCGKKLHTESRFLSYVRLPQLAIPRCVMRQG